MTRYELESWCEKFLNDVFENGKPVLELTAKSLEEEWEPEQLLREMIKLSPKTYSNYKKDLADFIEQFAKEVK